MKMSAMTAMKVFEKAEPARLDPASRGHHVVYRLNETNRCPGCGRAQWYVGRATAECGFCGTAVPLAEAKWLAAVPASRAETGSDASDGRNARHDPREKRRHPRVRTADRTLQLLIDGAPASFAMHDLSAGGAGGAVEEAAGLAPGSIVQVRFEGGILVPAVVRWTQGAHVGLVFETTLLIDLGDKGGDEGSGES
jgi:hypothetical protein